MDHDQCQLLFDAGRALIEKSGLASYDSTRFVACTNQEAFNDYWKKYFGPEFGRYMAWVLFSVGAENLAKAACVCWGVLKEHPKGGPSLEHYTRKKGHFAKLLCKAGLIGDAERTLKNGYKSLTDIRNRDAHAYRKNVRDDNFGLVQASFVQAFDVLAQAMRERHHPIHLES